MSSLFKFIEEVNKLKQKVVLNVSEYQWWCPVSSYMNDQENIKVYFRDRVEEEDLENSSNVLLSICKPELESCVKPDKIFEDWLEPGWDDYRKSATVVSVRKIPINESVLKNKISIEQMSNNGATVVENFSDNTNRTTAYNAWLLERNKWVEKQKKLGKTRKLFTDLYKISVELERDSETLELVVADGFIRDRGMSKINHPVITHRVKINYDATENVIYIEDTDAETELYTVLFQNMDDINISSVNALRLDLQENDYHPLDRNDTPKYLKTLVHQLSSESIYSETGIPESWDKKERLLLYRNPCYILRKRMDGTLKAIEQILDHVNETGDVPLPISDIVDGGKVDIQEDTTEESIEEQLASVGGESVDILLSKEANKEQLEIAKRIEKHNAVLVQGPPGTGKTHTIANLMGHFLAQGKSVLVTSHTKKALSVLKEKVASDLQSLCVSLLDDSNADMEKSIDGITSYMASYNAQDVKIKMNELSLERKEVIDELAKTRKKIFSIINQECNSIVYNGKSVSPSEMAKYVQENMESLSYIPGKVKLYEPLPLSFSELSELYQSNGFISTEDEDEFKHDIPNPCEIISPSVFEEQYLKIKTTNDSLDIVSNNTGWKIENIPDERKIDIYLPYGKITIDYPKEDDFEQLKKYMDTIPQFEPWMKQCAVDGKKGETYRKLWQSLIEEIKETCSASEKLVIENFGKEVEITDTTVGYYDAVNQLKSKYDQGGKIGKLAFMFNKQLEVALKGATINKVQPQNSEDCQLIMDTIELNQKREKCNTYWQNLMTKHGMTNFYDLDSIEPERVAANYIPYIERYLEWYDKEYEILNMRMESIGLNPKEIFNEQPFDSEIVATEKVLTAISDVIPAICDILDAVYILGDANKMLSDNVEILKKGDRVESGVCKNLVCAAESYDIEEYRSGYELLESTYAKSSPKHKREGYLKRLDTVAPQWADAIRRRDGINGDVSVPRDIEEAWLWKQYYGIIEEITSESFSDLQKKSLELSKEYRQVTADYAEKCAWYHLLDRTERDIDMKQALVGWKQTVKRIGKGTGKNAPMYRARAKELMAKCQKAVPGWIMTINKALENLDPSKNKFDVIIIDEASQSDISSLAILYMGKKLIIVGDDKQVSPMGVGIQTDKMNALKDMYISNKIPNAHLYDAKTSIYDIAATTFQPLMLHEHFRCVPEIIGFSNMLSYDFKIKPLRDCSSNLLVPPVVNYRVENGERIAKTNPNEAKAIVALMKSCMEQPEYKGKTMGVISLLGDEQVKKIQEEIYRNLDSKECKARNILCGNASNFQGDERDVIFLSVVDCANGNGPVAKKAEGVDDSNRKRYNVAVSRAKDQLWVVHSLDPANDLKSGDIRKTLIDYASNPDAAVIRDEEIKQQADSPFEVAVARYLTLKGYHLVQQWKVGAYRLDMVVVSGNKKVAIECDGERYHSGEQKIREDMERQTILERLGWRFIRIRGSEYFRNPEQTMERVISEIASYDILPEDVKDKEDKSYGCSELLERVKRRAHELLQIESNENGLDGEDDFIDSSVVAAALDPKNDIMSEKYEDLEDLEFIKSKNELDNNALYADVGNHVEKTIIKPILEAESKKKFCSLPIGCELNHLQYGIGRLKEIDESKKSIIIEFKLKTLKFKYPEAIIKGFLKIKDRKLQDIVLSDAE